MKVFDASEAKEFDKLIASLGTDGADTVIELSGNPQSLNLAMQLVGSEGKVVVGSWYGLRKAEIELGSKFHRGRIKIISSQVSRINPMISGRWDRRRRFKLAWHWLERIRPSQWITDKFPFEEAATAYRQIDSHPEKNIAVALNYQ